MGAIGAAAGAALTFGCRASSHTLVAAREFDLPSCPSQFSWQAPLSILITEERSTGCSANTSAARSSSTNTDA